MSKTGKDILNLYFKDNAENIDEKLKELSKGDVKIYKILVYEVVAELLYVGDVNTVFNNIIEDNIYWNNKYFDPIKFKIHQENQFIVKPLEIEEGVVQCSKCSSKRVFSYSRQCRGGDEPMTTFCECICGKKWSYSG